MINEKIKEKHRRWIKIIIIIFTVHILFILIKIPVIVQEKVSVDSAYQSIQNYSINETESYEECQMVEYKWNYSWEGWNPEQNGAISPVFRLINQENKRGEFEIQFAFFDDSKYSFADFQGIDYENVKEELGWNDASMLSDKLRYNMDPLQDIVITGYIRKNDPNGVYWAYANVTPPTYESCSQVSYYVNRTKELNLTKFRTENVTKNVTKKISLWDYIGIKFA